MVWERNVSHSIRPEIGDGFLLPYGELLGLDAATLTRLRAERVI